MSSSMAFEVKRAVESVNARWFQATRETLEVGESCSNRPEEIVEGLYISIRVRNCAMPSALMKRLSWLLALLIACAHAPSVDRSSGAAAVREAD